MRAQSLEATYFSTFCIAGLKYRFCLLNFNNGLLGAEQQLWQRHVFHLLVALNKTLQTAKLIWHAQLLWMSARHTDLAQSISSERDQLCLHIGSLHLLSMLFCTDIGPETALFYAIKKARSVSSNGHASVVICRFIFLGDHFYLLAISWLLNPDVQQSCKFISPLTVINSDPVISSTTLFL